MEVLRLVKDCISTYPRKGTETEQSPRLRHSVPDFNLSPQGDGNFFIVVSPLNL